MKNENDWKAISSLVAFTATGAPDSTVCSEKNIKGLHKFNLNLREVFSSIAPLTTLDKIVNQICPEKKVDVSEIDKKVNAGIFAMGRPPSEIKTALKRGKPVGIEFTTKMISQEMVSNHAAVMIGMQYDKVTKQCQYVLKDSYGKSCRPNLNPGVQCDPKTGYYLVPESLSEKYISSIYYFK